MVCAGRTAERIYSLLMKRKVGVIMENSSMLSDGPLDSITGLLLIILGILALIFPVLVFSLLIVFFAIFAGIVSFGLILSGMSDPGETNVYRTLKVLAGVIGLLLAFSFLVAPYVFTVAAKDLFGIWAIITGAASLLSVFAGESGMVQGLNALSGLVLAALGILILISPAIITDYLLVVILAIFAILTGLFSLWFARMKPAEDRQIDHTIYK
jgi:uncharacterized membrane protein HdeD (DUF308 family)